MLFSSGIEFVIEKAYRSFAWKCQSQINCSASIKTIGTNHKKSQVSKRPCSALCYTVAIDFGGREIVRFVERLSPSRIMDLCRFTFPE